MCKIGFGEPWLAGNAYNSVLTGFSAAEETPGAGTEVLPRKWYKSTNFCSLSLHVSFLAQNWGIYIWFALSLFLLLLNLLWIVLKRRSPLFVTAVCILYVC